MRAFIVAVAVLSLVDPASAGTSPDRGRDNGALRPALSRDSWSELARNEFLSTCLTQESEAFCVCWLERSEARFSSQREFTKALNRSKPLEVLDDIDRCLFRHGRGS